MLLVQFQSDPAGFTGRKKSEEKGEEKLVALRLASCARVPRDASLNLERGLSGPRFIPSVQGLRPLKILPPSARGGRAHSPFVGAGTLAGALCVSGDTPAAKAAIMEKIDATGLSPSAMCLAVLLDVPLPRRRRPSVDTKLLVQVLAELGKIGSNINQIAYHLNAGRPGDVMEGSVESALAELLEWRTALMQALGYERSRKPRDAN